MTKNSKKISLKYRPQTFEDLIGQEVTAKTIYNSIKSQKIPNAYLFIFTLPPDLIKFFPNTVE